MKTRRLKFRVTNNKSLVYTENYFVEINVIGHCKFKAASFK